MTRTILMALLIAPLAASCGEDELDPTPGALASVAAYSTASKDVTLHDGNGRGFPARIYYNDAAASAVERFPQIAEVIAADDDSAAPKAGSEEAPSTAGDQAPAAIKAGTPWLYVRIGTSPDGDVKGLGWRADLGWLFPEQQESQPPTFADSPPTGYAEPGYQAAADSCPPDFPCNWSFAVGLDDDKDPSGLIHCDWGLDVDGSCTNVPFGGQATAQLRHDSDTGTIEMSDTFSCWGSPIIHLESDDNAENWYVVIDHCGSCQNSNDVLGSYAVECW